MLILLEVVCILTIIRALQLHQNGSIRNSRLLTTLFRDGEHNCIPKGLLADRVGFTGLIFYCALLGNLLRLLPVKFTHRFPVSSGVNLHFALSSDVGQIPFRDNVAIIDVAFPGASCIGE